LNYHLIGKKTEGYNSQQQPRLIVGLLSPLTVLLSQQKLFQKLTLSNSVVPDHLNDSNPEDHDDDQKDAPQRMLVQNGEISQAWH